MDMRILYLGSGSTYIYGHCDATYKKKMTKEECYRFVANGKNEFLSPMMYLNLFEDV